MTPEQIARVCYEVACARDEVLGSFPRPAWDDLAQEMRDEVLAHVVLHMSGDYGPEARHERWLRHKLREGWKYGGYDDPVHKMHPAIAPFLSMSREYQANDHMFRAIVHALRPDPNTVSAILRKEP